MADTEPELTRAKKLKLAGLFALAVVVALSWLALGLFVGPGPGGFAISSGTDGGAPAAATTGTPVENLSVDELRESLSRTNRGGRSTTSMTVIWGTEPYFKASDISAEAFRVDPASDYVFIVFLDTHTGRLARFNWTRDARLSVDSAEYAPVDGYTRAGGYHHMVAVVQFPKTVDGQPVATEGTERVTLSVIGLERTEPELPDDRPRNVTWPYPPPYHDVPPEAFEALDCDCTRPSGGAAGGAPTGSGGGGD